MSVDGAKAARLALEQSEDHGQPEDIDTQIPQAGCLKTSGSRQEWNRRIQERTAGALGAIAAGHPQAIVLMGVVAARFPDLMLGLCQGCVGDFRMSGSLRIKTKGLATGNSPTRC